MLLISTLLVDYRPASPSFEILEPQPTMAFAFSSSIKLPDPGLLLVRPLDPALCVLLLDRLWCVVQYVHLVWIGDGRGVLVWQQ